MVFLVYIIFHNLNYAGTAPTSGKIEYTLLYQVVIWPPKHFLRIVHPSFFGDSSLHDRRFLNPAEAE
jgi:hypothetical protein